jgi:NAD(P)-dependent dehydrogenase (short-subunit alcohol dehydrogenase family)
MGRLGEPLDIAEGVVYLASDGARFVTGTELVIDGGFLAR